MKTKQEERDAIILHMIDGDDADWEEAVRTAAGRAFRGMIELESVVNQVCERDRTGALMTELVGLRKTLEGLVIDEILGIDV